MNNKELSLPDFDDFAELANTISEKSRIVNETSDQLDSLLAKITLKVTYEPSYWLEGKPPSMTFIKSTYHIVGFDDESRDKLAELRRVLIDAEANLEQAKHLFKIFQSRVDVWRTRSANERGSLL